ncbi:MAG: hypothetical protein ACRD0Q_03580 [Acidimicrobiales bacterium]
MAVTILVDADISRPRQREVIKDLAALEDEIRQGLADLEAML